MTPEKSGEENQQPERPDTCEASARQSPPRLAPARSLNITYTPVPLGLARTTNHLTFPAHRPRRTPTGVKSPPPGGGECTTKEHGQAFSFHRSTGADFLNDENLRVKGGSPVAAGRGPEMASTDSQVVVSVAEGEGLDVWDLASGKCLHSVDVRGKAFAVADSEEHLVLVEQGRSARRDSLALYSWRTGRSVTKVPMKFSVTAVAVCQSCAYLAAGSADGRVYLWDLDSGWLLQAWDAHYKPVSSLAFSTCGAVVATGGNDATVHCWSVASMLALQPNEIPKSLASFSDHSLPVTCLTFGIGGITAPVVSASMDGTVCAYDVPSKARVLSCSVGSAVLSTAVDSLVRYVLCGCADGGVRRVWLTGSGGGRVETFKGHNAGVTGVAISWEGGVTVSCSLQGDIILRDERSMQALRTVKSRRKALSSLAIVLNRQVLRAQSTAGAEADSKASYPPFKRDLDVAHRWPPSTRAFASTRRSPRRWEAMKESTTPGPTPLSPTPLGPRKRTAPRALESGGVKVARTASASSPASAKRVQALESEVAQYKRASEELYQLCAEKLLGGLARARQQGDEKR